MESPIPHLMTPNASGSASLSQTNSKNHVVLAKKSAPASSQSSNITSLQGPVSSSSSSSSSSTSASPELLRCKRRINFGGLGYALPQAQPATVARRNERERNRVKMVNLGFATLRQHVPNGAKNKKMSKVETLKSAVEYIRQLQQLLGDSDDVSCTNGQYPNNSQRQSSSSDENWNPSPSTLSPSEIAQSPASFSYSYSIPINNGTSNRASPSCSPMSSMVANSPAPSMGSDASSPYDSLDSVERQVSPEEEDLFDFTNWFS